MSKKILLADDSITIQKVIELTFSDEDFDVITVGNGRLALEKLPEVRPDIVLCDIIMPEKDGYEVCEQIKTNPDHSHVPVLLLTGAFEPFDQERAARAGYDGSLAKPFEPETLIAKVKDLLARAPVRAAAPPPPLVRPTPAAPPAAVVPPPPVVRPAPPVPAATLATVPPPAVLPFQRPAAPAPPPFVAPAAAAPSFIPDEPFGGSEDSAFAEPAAPSAAAFVPMTEEESATLLAPPSPEPAPADAASTVMFRAAELPWNAPPVPAAPEPPPFAAPVATPLAAPPPEAVDEPAVFEEVLEEDLDFGVQGFEPEPQVEPVPDEASGALLMPAEDESLPPIQPPDEGSATGAFVPVSAEPPPAYDYEPAPAFEREREAVFEPEPTPAFEPEPAPAFEREREAVFEPEPMPVFEPEPVPVFEPEPVPVFEPEPVPAFEREREAVFEPEPAPAFEPVAPPVAAESFADVALGVAAAVPPAPPPSEAAAVSVPVEMVEKIAQRVVAQISEKAVREIAWEVIPELAEALIKQEIERLKAELQKI